MDDFLRRSIEQLLGALLQQSGKQWFDSVAMGLATIVGADSVIVGKFANENKKLRTVAFCVDRAIAENFSYDVAGTPCEALLVKELCVYPDRVKDAFPENQALRSLKADAYIGRALFGKNRHLIGIVAAFYRTPLGSNEARYVEAFGEFVEPIAHNLEAVLNASALD